MGSGIAQVCAQKGLSVFLMDPSPAALEKALEGIRWSLERLYAKEAIQEPPEVVVARIETAWNLTPASRSDWVIEAALEDESLKKEIFRELD